jgi:hypothetical protein
MSDVSDEPMMITCEGRAVPARFVKPQRRLEDQLVIALAAKADALHAAIVAFKAECVTEIETFKALLAEQYNVKLGGRREGVQLHSFDLSMRVQVSVADTLTFGPELLLAKTLIDECLTEWSDGADARLKAIVMSAFDVGEGGRLRVDRVLALRQLDIGDDKWMRAMHAINDALTVARSKQYVRIYRRPNVDTSFEQIVLDASRV